MACIGLRPAAAFDDDSMDWIESNDLRMSDCSGDNIILKYYIKRTLLLLQVDIQSGPSNNGSLLSAMDDCWTPLKQLVLYDEIIIIHHDGRAEPPDHRRLGRSNPPILHRRKERYREPAMTTTVKFKQGSFCVMWTPVL